ncbi:hypothetical protein RN001_014686 [Aquatica leii]|uniref:ubiquitinyl hydrolase 1 n=1 Tax=Aquatica leii TaxID=1421715 RepID=A0AAN7SBK5_9COLE|nr:hypothetical protein RN001_014686 [Aquatica leii]
MDQVEPSYVEFLDLTGIEEQERNWILSSLYASNPNIQLPWGKEDLPQDDAPYYDLKSQNQLHSNYELEPTYSQHEIETEPTYNNVHVNGVEIKQTNHTNHEEVLTDNHNHNLPEQKNSVTPENAHIPAKSWASLFNKNVPASNIDFQQQNHVSKLSVVPPKSSDFKSVVNNVNIASLKEPFKSNIDDPNLFRMGEYLSVFNVDNRIISLQPRGLINRSNYCYINSILQAMLACPPVYNLLCGLGENTTASTEKKRITPTIDSMTKFVKEFHHLPAGMRVGRRLDKNQKKEHNISINCDTPFEPYWFHKLLSGMRSDTFVVEGRQEDAEEFLCCLLNGLNDEMLELMKLVGDDAFKTVGDDLHLSPDEDKEWQVMGPKNKGAITRRTEFRRTPISDIFGGSLRSRLHRTGDQSTDNIQPFFTLQLNIEKSSTVREALEILVCKNQLEGVTSSKTNEEVEAWQQVTVEELPLVLVLHLKCFDYKLDGCSKIMKALEFPIDLKIDAKLLSSKTNYAAKEKQYKLFAVVYHEGKEATKGHYITDAYHVGYASWLRYDDASVKAIPEEHVLNPLGTRVPYLLFYRRSDSLSKSK